MIQETEIALGAKRPAKGALGKVARKRKAPAVPVHDDPLAELRRLTKEHAATMKRMQAMDLSIKDRKMSVVDPVTKRRSPSGETIPCLLAQDVRDATKSLVDVYKAKADAIARDMLRELKKTDIYNIFISKMYGWGPKTAPYLVALIDFTRCEKPSNLRRFCGLGVFVDGEGQGHADRARKGVKLSYCADIKRALYLFHNGLQKQSGKSGTDDGAAKSEALAARSKYWRRFVEAKHGALSTGMPAGKAQDKARRKMCDLFIEDLYIVGRTLAGLPVWPSWYAKALGYEHGGKVAVLAPKMLTIDEALTLVGVAGADAVELVDDEESEGE